MEKVEESEREALLSELRRFRTLRSIEIARSNLDRLQLLVECAQKDMKIRELVLENSRCLDLISASHYC